MYYRRKWRDELAVSPRGRGYLYWFQGRYELPFFYKCGRAKDLEQRLSQHKTGASPFGVYLVAAVRVKNDRRAELIVHRRFKGDHMKTDTNGSEWFIFSPKAVIYTLLIQDYTLTNITRKKY